ncbi:MAG: ABC transporter ATP-binding protein [Thermoanaerobaculia bacterium]
MLAAESVSFCYSPGAPALDAVSVRFAEGQLTSIVGANGSGKSTLMRLLARVVAPETGDVLLRGRSLRHWSAREYAQRVGYLPQQLEFDFPMRAFDVVLSGRAPYLGRFEWEGAEDEAAATRALEACDALHLAERHLDEMSGGERKRILLARVLAGGPEIILLDEPFTALDLAHVQTLALLLQKIVRESGTTVVVVSHDLNWSAAISNRMIVLEKGSIVLDAPPDDVLRPEVMARHFAYEAERIVSPDGRAWILPRVGGAP